MKTSGPLKKYVFHYGSSPVHWLYARSINGIIRRLSAMGMASPVCIEACHGPEIWWKEDQKI